MLDERGPFPGSPSLQTGHARFPGIRLSGESCRVRDRVAWIQLMACRADDACLGRFLP